MTWVDPPEFEDGEVWLEEFGDNISADLNYLKAQADAAAAAPVIHVATGSPVALANDTTTTIVFDAESFKRGLVHPSGGFNERVGIPAGDIYLMSLNVDFDANATGRRYCAVALNGVVTRQRSVPPVTGAATSIGLAFTKILADGDYFTVQAYQNSGGALNCYPNFEVVWVAKYP